MIIEWALFAFVFLQVTTEGMLEHVEKLLRIPGSKLLFGGRPLEGHSIPSIYGALEPTALFVPLAELVKENNFELASKEIFGPFQVMFPRARWVRCC